MNNNKSDSQQDISLDDLQALFIEGEQIRKEEKAMRVKGDFNTSENGSFWINMHADLQKIYYILDGDRYHLFEDRLIDFSKANQTITFESKGYPIPISSLYLLGFED